MGQHVADRSFFARAVLAAELALMIAVLAHQFPHWWEQRWVQDDAYVSFRYARNLVRGEGLVYNPGERVEGYTNFLWTVLATVPLAREATDPLPFMHEVSAVLWVASFALLLVLGIGLWAEGLWAGPLIALPLAFHWSYNLWFVSGMETPLVTFCTIAAVCAVAMDSSRHRWAPFAASLSAVALMLSRPDGAVVCAGLVLAVLGLDGAYLRRARPWRTHVLAPAVPLLLIFAPYQLWRLWYYGSLLPNTYYAKAAYLPFWSRGLHYVGFFAWIYRLWPFLPILIAGAGVVRTSLARRFLCAALIATAATVLYVARLGGDFMEWRFLTPVSGVFYPAIVVAASALGARYTHRAGGWVAGVLIAGLLTAATIDATPAAQTRCVPDQETIDLLRRYTDASRFDWRGAGQVFDAVLPPGTRVATTSAGIIPYLCDRPTLDLHGLTDAVLAREPVDPNARGRMGHEHWLQDYAAIRARGVDVVLEWVDPNPYPRAINTPPGATGELVSVRVRDGHYVDFTLLNPALRPQLTDPRLVFYDPAEIADATRLQGLAERFVGWRVIDRLDWGDEQSEAAHDFSESIAAAPYARAWHTKLLRYLPPFDDVQLEDDGRRVSGWATWRVDDVRADRPLALVARLDYTGPASFALEVNGRRAPDLLIAPHRHDEWWDEVALTIPPSLLADGSNTLRLIRLPESPYDAEIYHMWFLQPEI
jgi:arabinofuranosyltransferase